MNWTEAVFCSVVVISIAFIAFIVISLLDFVSGGYK
jgi:hypothetical protein